MSGARQRGPSISIGGAVSGSAVAAGSGNEQHVASHGPASDPAMVAALEAVREAIARLDRPHAIVARASVDEAIEESKKPEPDHHVIGAALNSALAATKKVADLGDTVAKILPWLTQLGVLLAPYGLHLGF
jgi:hypothetical protein